MTQSPKDTSFEAALSSACQYLNGKERVLYTKWKDSIDIEYPTLMIERFARAIWDARGEADAMAIQKLLDHAKTQYESQFLTEDGRSAYASHIVGIGACLKVIRGMK
jgi:hypothetical protein